MRTSNHFKMFADEVVIDLHEHIELVLAMIA